MSAAPSLGGGRVDRINRTEGGKVQKGLREIIHVVIVVEDAVLK